MSISGEERIQSVRDAIYPAYAQISYVPLRIQALSHTSMVETWARCLALRRGIPDDLAVCAAICHDIARYEANTSVRHAFKGARMAQSLLEESNRFSPDEIHRIIHAVACHSSKDAVDDPLCEVLKDADTLASWSVNPDAGLSPARQRRIESLQRELGWTCQLPSTAEDDR